MTVQFRMVVVKVLVCEAIERIKKIPKPWMFIMGSIGTAILAGVAIMKGMPQKTLKVGFPFSWGKLTPSLQHTAYADTIIKNQFEPLVQVGIGGKIEPLAAASWMVSSDFQIFTFKIDTARKFSDGVPLSAQHFKQAWEQALALQPQSANSSLQNLLYKVEGYEDFDKT